VSFISRTIVQAPVANGATFLAPLPSGLDVNAPIALFGHRLYGKSGSLIGAGAVAVRVSNSLSVTNNTGTTLQTGDEVLIEIESKDRFGTPVLWASLTNTLVPEIGPSPIFFRDTTGGGLPHVTDYRGYLRKSVAGECLFHGARRLQQLCRNNENLTNTASNGWTPWNSATVVAPGTSLEAGPDENQTAWKITRAASTASSALRAQATYVLRAVPHYFAVECKAGTLSTAEIGIWDAANVLIASKVVTISATTWQRFAIQFTPDGTTAYRYGFAAGSLASGVTGTVYVAQPDLKEALDALDVAPEEFVPIDSYPANKYYYGAGVDGVKYLNTANGNSWSASSSLVTPGEGAVLNTMKGVITYPSVINLFLNTATMSSATASGATLGTSPVAGPDGAATMIRLTEDTGNSAHYWTQTITSSTYDNRYVAFSVYVDWDSTQGRDWARLVLIDLAGATQSAYFDLRNATAGTVTHGVACVEVLNSRERRLIWNSLNLGTDGGAGTDAIVRGYICTANNTPTHLGESKTMDWFLPNITAPLGATTGQDRPLATPAYHVAGTASNLPGSLITYEVEGVIGYSNFAVVSDYSAYYLPAQVDKRSYTAVTYLRTNGPVQNAVGALGTFDLHRTGLTVRPNNSPGTAHTSKFAFDFYTGDLNRNYFWQPDTIYAAGAIVIRSATLPDNSSGLKMFTAVVGGRSRSAAQGEPSWVNTYTAIRDTSSNLTIDNEVRWQVNEDNGINGSWEPYLGAHKVPSGTFLSTSRFAWFITDTIGQYGCFENGVEFTKQTIKLSERLATVLTYKPKILSLGTFGSNKGIPPSALGTATAPEVMSIHMSCHKNLRIYKTKMTAVQVADMSGLSS